MLLQALQTLANRVYLDWNATTPLRPEAAAAMSQAMEDAGNPSSVHAEGRRARRLIEDARCSVAKALNTDSAFVVFTSGGTESNATALAPSLCRRGGEPVRRLLVSAVEHASVLAGGRFAAEAIEVLPVDRQGRLDLDALAKCLRGGPSALVSLMAANNETGAIQPVEQAAALVHGANGILHVDAIQMFGKIALDLNALQADLLSISAHKLGGPKGVGALIMRDDITLPLLRGGGQERGRRAGTENVLGIAGFGAAAAAAAAEMDTVMPRVEALRDRLEAGLQAVGAVVFAAQSPRLPNTSLVSAAGLRSETVLIALDLGGIAVSSGSACSSGKIQPSHVLAAMDVDSALARGAIRFSLGWTTTEEDIDRAIEAWRKLPRTLLK